MCIYTVQLNKTHKIKQQLFWQEDVEICHQKHCDGKFDTNTITLHGLGLTNNKEIVVFEIFVPPTGHPIDPGDWRRVCSSIPEDPSSAPPGGSIMRGAAPPAGPFLLLHKAYLSVAHAMYRLIQGNFFSAKQLKESTQFVNCYVKCSLIRNYWSFGVISVWLPIYSWLCNTK